MAVGFLTLIQAGKEWPATLVLAVVLDQVEGEQDRPHTPRRKLELVEKGQSVRADDDSLAVYKERPAKLLGSLGDQGKAVCPVIAAPGE
jgi:hypothetical protein